jgi:hypothetical protein
LTLALYYGIAAPLFCVVVLCCLPFAWMGLGWRALVATFRAWMAARRTPE